MSHSPEVQQAALSAVKAANWANAADAIEDLEMESRTMYDLFLEGYDYRDYEAVRAAAPVVESRPEVITCIMPGCKNEHVHDGACACYVNGVADGEERAPAAAVPQWVPVSERLPKDSRICPVAFLDSRTGKYALYGDAYYSGHTKEWMDDTTVDEEATPCRRKVALWLDQGEMPALPAAPLKGGPQQ